MNVLRKGWETGRSYLDNPLLRRLFHNAGWLLADRVARLGLGVLVLGWTARYLGPSDFGILSYAQAIVVLVTSIAQFGLTDVIIREIVRHPDRRNVILSCALAIRILMGGTAVALSCLIVHLMAPGDRLSLVITFALSISLLFQAGEVLECDLQARNSVIPAVAGRSIAFFLCGLAKIGGILAGVDTLFFAVMVAVEAAIAALFFAFGNREGWRLIGFRSISFEEVGLLLGHASPLFLRTAAIAFYMRIDQIMLSHFFGKAAVGIYSSAVRLAELWIFLPVAIMTALVPTLAGSYVVDLDRYHRHLKQAMRFLVYSTVGFALAMTLFAPSIVSMVYGANYQASVDILRVYIWSSVFGTLGLATSAWFVNAGLTRYAFYQALIGLACSVGLNLMLIPATGAMGAAFAYLITQIMVNWLLNALFAATRPIFRLQTEVLTFR